MMKRVFGALAMGAMLVTGGVWAAGDPKAGQAKSELCQGCHGVDGMSVNPECPNLAGQRGGYIIKQMLDFQKGHRDNPTMTPMAAMVTDMQDLKDIAAYYQSQKVMSSKRAMFGHSSGDKKKIAKGKKIYYEGAPERGVYACVNCHGKKGMGRDPNNHIFPVIGGQMKEYLVKQLQDFKSGQRRNDPAGMMVDVAKRLSDEEIEAVADYLSSL